jgi:hypothetical protein
LFLIKPPKVRDKGERSSKTHRYGSFNQKTAHQKSRQESARQKDGRPEKARGPETSRSRPREIDQAVRGPGPLRQWQSEEGAREKRRDPDDYRQPFKAEATPARPVR